MKLKDFLSKAVENKRNGQINVCLKKGEMKRAGISKEQLLNMKVDTITKRLLFDED